MAKIIECTCGSVITGGDDEELVANAREHARGSHPDWPDATDDELLAMAIPAE